MRKVKGLSISVYSHPTYRGCANGGISECFDELIMVGEKVEGWIEVDLDNPPENTVYLVHREMFGKNLYHVTPLDSHHADKFMGRDKCGNTMYKKGGKNAKVYCAKEDCGHEEAGAASSD